MIFKMNSITIYFLIFIAKILDIALSTFRTVLIARNERFVNTIIAFIQSAIYIITAATVITNIANDPFRIIAYVIGCAVGSYFGMYLDEKMAIGQDMLTVILDEDSSKLIIKRVRDEGYGVTVLQGKGRYKDRVILMIAIKRKKEKDVIKIIKGMSKDAMIIDNSITTLGGRL